MSLSLTRLKSGLVVCCSCPDLCLFGTLYTSLVVHVQNSNLVRDKDMEVMVQVHFSNFLWELGKIGKVGIYLFLAVDVAGIDVILHANEVKIASLTGRLPMSNAIIMPYNKGVLPSEPHFSTTCQ